jgi:nucleoside 2-deoxyribosyltransferase
MIKASTVYLAGPITGCSFDECVDWREKMISQLPSEIVGFSPMRGKTYLEGSKEIAASYEEKSDNSLKQVMSCARGITTRDFNDCKRADAIVVNLVGAKKVSIGTVMEIAWGKAFNIPVILIIEENGNIHEHPMIMECVGFRVNTVDQALDVLKMLLMPTPHRSR